MSTGATRRDRPDGERGLTLVEMLVVLAIIAIIASVSAMAIGSGGGLDGRAEAKRLEARLQLAADQTMIEDRQLALSVAPDRYGFLELDTETGEWLPSTVSSLAEPHRLPRGIELRGTGNAPILPLGADGSGQGFSLTLVNGRQSWTIDFDGVTARQSGAVRSGLPSQDRR